MFKSEIISISAKQCRELNAILQTDRDAGVIADNIALDLGDGWSAELTIQNQCILADLLVDGDSVAFTECRHFYDMREDEIVWEFEDDLGHDYYVKIEFVVE